MSKRTRPWDPRRARRLRRRMTHRRLTFARVSAYLRMKYSGGFVERLAFGDHPLLAMVRRTDAEVAVWERRYDQHPLVPRAP